MHKQRTNMLSDIRTYYDLHVFNTGLKISFILFISQPRCLSNYYSQRMGDMVWRTNKGRWPMLHLILIKETTNYCSGHEGLGIMIRPIITGYYIIHRIILFTLTFSLGRCCCTNWWQSAWYLWDTIKKLCYNVNNYCNELCTPLIKLIILSRMSVYQSMHMYG